MSELRRRKIGAQNRNPSDKNPNAKKSDTFSNQRQESWPLVVELVFALVIAVTVGYKYALYVKELHENDMWFSNIGVSKIYR